MFRVFVFMKNGETGGNYSRDFDTYAEAAAFRAKLYDSDPEVHGVEIHDQGREARLDARWAAMEPEDSGWGEAGGVLDERYE
jgi:hypothetical protein